MQECKERRAAVLRTVTVGGSGADIVGMTGRDIQLAINALAYQGGGTVRLGKGVFLLSDSVRMRPGVSLVGEGPDTILRRKDPLISSELLTDADAAQRQITPTHPERFVPGMGLILWDKRMAWHDPVNPVRVLDCDSEGNLQIDRLLITDRLVEENARVFNFFPMIQAHDVPGVRLEGMRIEAKVEDPANMLPMTTLSAVSVYRSPDAVLRHLSVTGSPGDGITVAKASERPLIEDCESAYNGVFGIHPGSHSQRTILRRCHIHHNGSDGLYICWGIRHGEFYENHIHHNGWRNLRSGISIGHKDSDCLIADNHIHDNAKYGVCFRVKTAANGPHRCTLRGNMIENNGSAPDQLTEIKGILPAEEAVGCGVDVCGIQEGLRLEGNTIRETRAPEEAWQRVGIRIHEGVINYTIADDNRIEGHPEDAIRK